MQFGIHIDLALLTSGLFPRVLPRLGLALGLHGYITTFTHRTDLTLHAHAGALAAAQDPR